MQQVKSLEISLLKVPIFNIFSWIHNWYFLMQKCFYTVLVGYLKWDIYNINVNNNNKKNVLGVPNQKKKYWFHIFSLNGQASLYSLDLTIYARYE